MNLTISQSSWSHELILKVWYYEIHWSYSRLLIDHVDIKRWMNTLEAAMKKWMSKEQVSHDIYPYVLAI